MFNKLVKFIHINIGKNLRCQIANWYASSFKKAWSTCHKALDDFSQEIHNFLVFNFPIKNANEHIMVNRIKEFSDIALQSIALSGIILAYSSNHFRNFFHSLVCSFAYAARKRIWNKGRFKYWIQNVEYRMVQYSIAYCGFVDMTKFWIVNIKAGITTMFVCFITKIPIYLKNILFKIFLKAKDIKFFPFTLFKFIPRQKKILRLNYSLK